MRSAKTGFNEPRAERRVLFVRCNALPYTIHCSRDALVTQPRFITFLRANREAANTKCGSIDKHATTSTCILYQPVFIAQLSPTADTDSANAQPLPQLQTRSYGQTGGMASHFKKKNFRLDLEGLELRGSSSSHRCAKEMRTSIVALTTQKAMCSLNNPYASILAYIKFTCIS